MQISPDANHSFGMPMGLLNDHHWLVISTHLKNMSQIGNLPQIGVKIQDI